MKISKYFLLSIILLIPGFLISQSITNTVHNLSVSGPGIIKAQSESEICIFCHIPHNSSPSGPLWNRADPGFNYTLYTSTTIQASIGQPSGSSVLCLSCHDGTIALGSILSRTNPIDFAGGVTTMPSGSLMNLTQDISNDHPVSFIYNASLASSDGELVDPAGLLGPVRLENEMMQCTSCHDAHDNNFGDFLVASTQYSDLCLYCHQKDYWTSSGHSSSNILWNGLGNDPWFHTAHTTVSENACENCHNPHNADGHTRLMNSNIEETNCLNCHNGNAASRNLEIMFSRFYIHNIYGYNDIHDTNENSVVQIRHVECEDCHNPHASTNAPASAPNANGSIRGTKGVDTNGNPVYPIQYEYELCNRCHADSPDKPGSPTTRQIEQNNVRLEFDLNNPSFHPIEGPGTNSNVPSLISPYNESSIIYCTDCHASDGVGSPAGPHGSTYPRIMKYNYSTADSTQESSFAYELCYQCHNRTTIINSGGRFGQRVHRLHIVDEDTPCNACHDPHGINSAQVTTSDHTHLINFDLSIVTALATRTQPEFIDDGNYSGRCYLDCHGEEHDSKSY